LRERIGPRREWPSYQIIKLGGGFTSATAAAAHSRATGRRERPPVPGICTGFRVGYAYPAHLPSQVKVTASHHTRECQPSTPPAPPDNTSTSGAPGQRSAAERVPRAAQPSGQSAHGLRLGARTRPRGRAPTGSVMQGNARVPRRVGGCQHVNERCRHSGRPLKGPPRAAALVLPHPPHATQDGASRPALQFRTSWSCSRILERTKSMASTAARHTTSHTPWCTAAAAGQTCRRRSRGPPARPHAEPCSCAAAASHTWRVL
jgi:hypothetical protein